MDITIAQNGKITTLTISGKVDVEHIERLEDTLSDLIKKDCHFLIIDCQDVDYLSSKGMHAFLHAQKELEKNHGKIFFVSFCPAVLEVLENAGIAKYFQTYDSSREAYNEMLQVIESV